MRVLVLDLYIRMHDSHNIGSGFSNLEGGLRHYYFTSGGLVLLKKL